VAIVARALAYVTSNGPNVSSILSAVPSWTMWVDSPNASITLIEFFDPLCPYCAIVHYRVGGELHRLVGEGRVQLILIPLGGTPTFIVVKGDQVAIIEGAKRC